MNNTKPEETISIPVDLLNPGQFFACCGLLELAHRLTKPGNRALGWFETVKAQSWFLIAANNQEGPVTLEILIRTLKRCDIKAINKESKEGPVLLGGPFNISLDWRSPFPRNALVKTFAGKQKIFEITRALQQAIPEIVNNDLLNYCGSIDMAITAFSPEKAEGTLDAGFSMDVQKNRLFRKPLILLEFLAQIGTQRFCPQKGGKNLERVYYRWQTPLPVTIAALYASQPLTDHNDTGYVFQMYKRDPDGRYKGFALSRKNSNNKGEKS